MFLNKVAHKQITEPMEAWDELTEQFIPDAFMGRIDLSDRFLSNFNKPLRRRMMFVEPKQPMPVSNVFRHPGTHDVYIAGQRRGDAIGGNHYLDLIVCHLATDTPGGSSGLGTLYRKTPDGPEDNPGWLTEKQLGKAYLDLEFRTSSNEPDMYETKIENYFCFLPIQWDLKPWDFIELDGIRYRVVDTFADSGLSGLRVDREPDTRMNFVLHTPGERVYNRDTHQWETTPGQFNVTGIMVKYHDFSSWSSESEPYIDVSIEEGHIGFRPVPGNSHLEFEGVKRVISQVSTQPGERQYRLRCR